MTNCFCRGATPVASFYYFPYGSWKLTINGIELPLEVDQRDSFSELHKILTPYKISVSILSDLLTFTNHADESYTIIMENLSEVVDPFGIEPVLNPTMVALEGDSMQVTKVKFCLAPKDVYDYTECGYEGSDTIDPEDLFGTPDGSCVFPLQESIPSVYSKLTDLRGLQNLDVLLHFKNNNEHEVQFQIFKVEGSGRFAESSFSEITNPTQITAPAVIAACLRGNTCEPLRLLPVENVRAIVKEILTLLPVEGVKLILIEQEEHLLEDKILNVQDLHV